MIDKTVLELVDRLVSTTARLTKAESEATEWKGKAALNLAKLDAAEGENARLTEEVASLKATIKEKESVISFWYEKATKFEEKLKKEGTDDKA